MKEELLRQAARGSASLRLHQEVRDTTLVLRLSGAFSLVNHARLDEVVAAITSSKAARIVLDMQQVVHMDSVGIGTLALALKHARTHNVLLVLVPSEPVRMLLTHACLDTVFHCTNTLEEALRF